jgi:transposase-like protein
MKRRYQIDQQRAVQEFRQPAREQNPNIQMIFPMAEVVGLLQAGVGHLLREAGFALMNLVIEEEVRHLAGERHEQHPARRAHRWGKENGYCVVDGQKVPIRRTRLRNQENREQRLGSYELFQRSAPLEHGVWDKMMRGLSTRNYGAVVKEFREAYGVEKSAVSDNFIAASREKLQELMERPLGELRLCAVLIDGTPFLDRPMIVVLGIGTDGRKTVLGLREGATENAAVVSGLLRDLSSRGLDFSVPRLYVLDGGKALAAAVRRHAGEAAMMQHCQVHKRRNVVEDHLPEEHKLAVKKKLQNAYAMTEYADAQHALERLHRETDGTESERRSQSGGRHGRNVHGASPAGASPVASHAGEHGFEESCCRGSEGCVAYDGRESLTFNGVPGNLKSLSFFNATLSRQVPSRLPQRKFSLKETLNKFSDIHRS